MTPRPLLYLAGPYTHNDPVTNTHAAAVIDWDEMPAGAIRAWGNR